MNDAVRSYKDLVAWQRAMDLAIASYGAASRFPKVEQFGLANQLRRAAVSIPSNIAEGHQKSRASFISHLRIAAGSHTELETQAELARRLGLVDAGTATSVLVAAAEVGRLIHGLIRSLTRQTRAVP